MLQFSCVIHCTTPINRSSKQRGVLGTIINTLTVLTGSALGLTLRRNLSESLKEKLLLVIGLFTIYLAVKMMIGAERSLSLILGTLLGTAVGHYLGLERSLENLSAGLSRKLGGDSKFMEGLLTPFLTFCVGPMTLVGSIKDGMGDPTVILAKSVMDCFSSMAFASAFGVSVLLSAFPLFIFQGSLALIGSFLGGELPEWAIQDTMAAGGIILLGLALRILKIRRIEVSDMLPSLIIVPLISAVLGA